MILIGNPRVASASMSMAFADVDNGIGILRNAEVRNEPANKVREKLGEDIWENCLTVAFVRHPIDRFMSARATSSEHTFDKRPDVPSMQSFLSYNPVIFRPQSEYLNEEIDFMGRYENIQEDWAKIRKIFKERFALSLGPLFHHNKSDAKKKKLTKEEEGIVREYYAEDFKKFGYE